MLRGHVTARTRGYAANSYFEYEYLKVKTNLDPSIGSELIALSFTSSGPSVSAVVLILPFKGLEVFAIHLRILGETLLHRQELRQRRRVSDPHPSTAKVSCHEDANASFDRGTASMAGTVTESTQSAPLVSSLLLRKHLYATTKTSPQGPSIMPFTHGQSSGSS